MCLYNHNIPEVLKLAHMCFNMLRHLPVLVEFLFETKSHRFLRVGHLIKQVENKTFPFIFLVSDKVVKLRFYIIGISTIYGSCGSLIGVLYHFVMQMLLKIILCCGIGKR